MVIYEIWIQILKEPSKLLLHYTKTVLSENIYFICNLLMSALNPIIVAILYLSI